MDLTGAHHHASVREKLCVVRMRPWAWHARVRGVNRSPVVERRVWDGTYTQLPPCSRHDGLPVSAARLPRVHATVVTRSPLLRSPVFTPRWSPGLSSHLSPHIIPPSAESLGGVFVSSTQSTHQPMITMKESSLQKPILPKSKFARAKFQGASNGRLHLLSVAALFFGSIVWMTVWSQRSPRTNNNETTWLTSETTERQATGGLGDLATGTRLLLLSHGRMMYYDLDKDVLDVLDEGHGEYRPRLRWMTDEEW